MSTSENSNPDAEGGRIAVAAAIEMTANWRSYLSQSGQQFNKKAFLIPINDLKGILESAPDAEAARVYIGLKRADDPASATLLLVPVVNGKDIVYFEDKEGDPNAVDDSNVYDYTKPCPPECVDDSPLN